MHLRQASSCRPLPSVTKIQPFRLSVYGRVLVSDAEMFDYKLWLWVLVSDESAKFANELTNKQNARDFPAGY